MGDVNIPTFYNLCCLLAYGLPVAYVSGIHFNAELQGIWYGLALGLLTPSALLYLKFIFLMTRALEK